MKVESNLFPIKIIQTDIEFIEEVIEEIKKGGGENGKKAHRK